MQRYKLTIEYDGTPYCGWQRQSDAPSVQETIERAFYQFAQETVAMVAAGRTDAGVHARGQVAHVDVACDRSCDVIRDGLNAWLKDEAVSILEVEQVAADFHARFHAVKRHYQYRILNRRAPSKLESLRVWHIAAPLDLPAMQSAARHLLGRHDFSSFRDSKCQATSPIRTLDTLDMAEDSEGNVTLTLCAQSFLHHQVRIITGTLVDIGRKKYPPEHMIEMLEAKSRPAAGVTAPAYGLYFMRVDY
jgi:tRNA pseudouridine38-40 synthase